MVVLVYLEGVVLLLLTLGYLLLATAGLAASSQPAWYVSVFLIGGSYGLTSLWWILVITIFLLQKNRRYAVPLLAKVGIGVGFAFAIFLVFYPWVSNKSAYASNPFPISVLCFMTIPFAITIHLVCLLWEKPKKQMGNSSHFLE